MIIIIRPGEDEKENDLWTCFLTLLHFWRVNYFVWKQETFLLKCPSVRWRGSKGNEKNRGRRWSKKEKKTTKTMKEKRDKQEEQKQKQEEQDK